MTDGGTIRHLHLPLRSDAIAKCIYSRSSVLPTAPLVSAFIPVHQCYHPRPFDPFRRPWTQHRTPPGRLLPPRNRHSQRAAIYPPKPRRKAPETTQPVINCANYLPLTDPYWGLAPRSKHKEKEVVTLLLLHPSSSSAVRSNESQKVIRLRFVFALVHFRSNS